MKTPEANISSPMRPLARLELASQFKQQKTRAWSKNIPALISQSIQKTRLATELRLDRLAKGAQTQERVLVFREFVKGETNSYTGKIVTARRELQAIGFAKTFTSLKEVEAFAKAQGRSYRVHDSVSDDIQFPRGGK